MFSVYIILTAEPITAAFLFLYSHLLFLELIIVRYFPTVLDKLCAITLAPKTNQLGALFSICLYPLGSMLISSCLRHFSQNFSATSLYRACSFLRAVILESPITIILRISLSLFHDRFPVWGILGLS